MDVVELLERHPAAWHAATRHSFLDAVREGTLLTGAFEAWLAQDYLFAADLLVFQSRLLARCPRPDQAVLAGGLVALEAELGWFEEKAEERGLKLEASRHPTTSEYRNFLIELENEPYTVGITALWALERAYLEAWESAIPGHPDYREFVEHWTTPEFADYVASLQRATGSALEFGSGGERERAEAAFLEVTRLEKDFWEMAWSATREASR
ncbi:MAG: TenA family transcriptional regulator [Actinomycetota bacterium]|nr:TenA family transcriptional regulator [Actinomycetota bacterium]